MARFRPLIPLLAGALVVLGPSPSFAQPDAAGCKDHPLVTRMSNMRIVTCKTVDFDRFAFKTGKATQEPVEGRRFEVRYQITTGQQAPARLAIIRNHQDAIKAIGGSVKYEDDRYTI
jgi:OOP family OmpA-OmpF porin